MSEISTSPLALLLGVGQLIALAGIFVRVGRVLEKSDKNESQIRQILERVRRLEEEH